MSKSSAEAALLNDLHLCGIEPPQREYRFHPTRRWRFDLAWPDRMLAVEVDGFGARGSVGRHQRPLGMDQDNEKANAAVLLGWRVLRFTSAAVKRGVALQTIERALADCEAGTADTNAS